MIPILIMMATILLLLAAMALGFKYFNKQQFPVCGLKSNQLDANDNCTVCGSDSVTECRSAEANR